MKTDSDENNQEEKKEKEELFISYDNYAGSNDVFWLSYTEVYQYFGDTHGQESDPDRICYPTEYAKNNTNLDISADACGWWLCAGTRGYNESAHKPYVVSKYGSLNL